MRKNLTRGEFSQEEDDALRRLYAGTSMSKMTVLLNRGKHAIRARAKQLALPISEARKAKGQFVSGRTPWNKNMGNIGRTPWTTEEENLLIDMKNQRITAKKIAEKLGRSVQSIEYKVRLLRAPARKKIPLPQEIPDNRPHGWNMRPHHRQQLGLQTESFLTIERALDAIRINFENNQENT